MVKTTSPKRPSVDPSSVDMQKCYICGLPIISRKAYLTEKEYGEVLCYVCKNNIEAVDKNHVREYLKGLMGLA